MYATFALWIWYAWGGVEYSFDARGVAKSRRGRTVDQMPWSDSLEVRRGAGSVELVGRESTLHVNGLEGPDLARVVEVLRDRGCVEE